MGASILVSLLIAALLSAAAFAVLSPRISQMQLQAAVIELQSMASDYRQQFCSTLPTSMTTTALAAALGEPEPTGRAGTVLFSGPGVGRIDVTFENSTLAWQAARTARGSVSGTTAQLPIPSRSVSHAVGVEELRIRSVGGNACL